MARKHRGMEVSTKNIPSRKVQVTWLVIWICCVESRCCFPPLVQNAEALETALIASRYRRHHTSKGQRGTRPIDEHQGCHSAPISSIHRLAQRKKNGLFRSVLLARGGESSLNSSSEKSDNEDANSQSRKAPAFMVPTYYLVWSPGVWKKIVASLFALLFFRLVYHSSQGSVLHSLVTEVAHEHSGLDSNASLQSPINVILNLLVLPMLSSACCGVQLLINALVGASGCAGFNKYLGPLRPYFFSILLYSTISSFPTFATGHSIQRWIGKSAISLFVAFMPEMVQVWNDRASRQWNVQHGATTRDENSVQATISLDIPSMGCVACINNINSSIRQCAPEQILEAKSWLEPSESGKGGKSMIKVSASSENEIQNLAQTLVEAVRGAGFETCTLDGLDVVA